MKKILLFTLLILFSSKIFAQCEVIATVIPDEIVCGDCVQLTAFGEGQGVSIFDENFDAGSPTGWQSTANATYSNPCIPHPDGTTHLWMGDATGVPRQMVTNPYDLTSALSGATICFDMVFAEQGDATPCEGPDEPDEGVALQYSIDGGTTWIDINYFDPNGGNDASLINWNNWCFPVPAAAITGTTQFRWFQDNDSGAEYDHWGLDNVNIYFNDPTYEIIWQHDNYSYGVGNGGGTNPNPACPQTTTTYTVIMSNGIESCQDQVTVNVTDPTFRVDAGTDTTVCAGECVDLTGEATVVVSPAKQPTYENAEISTFLGFPDPADLVDILLPCVNFGGCTCLDGSTVNFLESCPPEFEGSISMNINITDLNTTTLQNGELTSICISSVLMTLGDLTPLEVTLTCPSGQSIVLANAGDLVGTTITDACFDLTATTPIAAGTGPYTGTWQPVEPLTNLSGCDANGVWTLTFTGVYDLGGGSIPLGFLNGWDISFDDPEISYEGDLSWNPTTDMTNETTATPTICPTGTETYTVTVSDTAGCVTVTDDVTVGLDNNCCNFNMSAVVNQPTCGNNDGDINLTITNGSGNFSFDWNTGAFSTEDIGSLIAGSYQVTITDIDQGCSKDTTIVLAAPNSPSIDNVVANDATCGNSNGTITITASGGTGTLNYSIDNGVTFQTGNAFTGLAATSYDIVVEDANGCTATQSTTINNTNAPTIDNVVANDATCGTNNGSITITASGGTGTLNYSIDNGVTFQTGNSFTGLAATSYDIVVEDANGCTATQSTTVNNSNAPTIDNIVANDANCGASDGSITITASGGTGTLNYSIDNGVTFQTGNSFTGLAATSYDIVVEDANGCTVTQSTTVNNTNAPTIDNIVANDANCGASDGSITITASGGTGTLNYSIDNGVTFQTGNSFTGLAATSYDIVVEDANGCTVAQSTTVGNTNAPTIDNISTNDASCGANNGSITITATGGTGTLNYSIDNGVTFQTGNSFTGLTATSYDIVVEDANGCTVSQSTSVNNANAPTIDNIATNDETCGASNGSITITASGGTGTLNYSIDNGVTFQTGNAFTGLAANFYDIVVEDANGCTVSQSTSIANSNAPTIDNVIATDILCNGQGNGTLTISVSGGTPNYEYSIDNITFQSSNSFQNLDGGNYTVYIQDANGCTTQQAGNTIQEPTALQIQVANFTDVQCDGGNDGSITVSVNGGTAGYTYSIDGGATTQNNGTFNNLSQGNYTIDVLDANNCPISINQAIAEPTPVTATISMTDAICNGAASGSITIESVQGGGTTPSYEVSIDGLPAVPYTPGFTFNNLNAGFYDIEVFYNQSCPSYSETIEINDLPALVFDTAMTTDVLCYGDETGSVVLGYSGGTPDYTFFVQTEDGDILYNETGEFIEVLAAGVYETWAEDANGCTTPLENFGIFEPNPLVIDTHFVEPVSCFDEEDGVISVFAEGSYPPFTFTIDDEEAANQINDTTFIAEAGSYTVTVTDNQGCTSEIDLFVNQPDPVIANVTPEEAEVELDGTIQLTAWAENGIGDLTYVWLPETGLSCTDCADPVVMIFDDEEYSVTITDENGCVSINTATAYISVIHEMEYFIPNAFTPDNNDGTNDEFRVFGNAVKYVDMRIYNRWGEKIYETNEKFAGWDGTYKGVLQQPGVYTYDIKITFLNDKEIDAKGSVTLLR